MCHNEPSKYDLIRHESPSISVVIASDRCTGHGVDSRRGLRFILCPTLVTNVILLTSFLDVRSTAVAKALVTVEDQLKHPVCLCFLLLIPYSSPTI